MNYYFIDYENIHADGLKNIDSLQENDAIIIFYSDQCKGITLDVIEYITNHNVKINCHKVKIGTKNALDFQLSSYLGYILGMDKDAVCHIVSNDKGFDCLCDYWQDLHRSVNRMRSRDSCKDITKTSLVQEPTKKKKKSKVKASDLATLEDIKKLLSTDDEPADVLSIFNQFKTKVAINNGLVKKFKDTKRASSVYQKLKPLLKEKNKS